MDNMKQVRTTARVVKIKGTSGERVNSDTPPEVNSIATHLDRKYATTSGPDTTPESDLDAQFGITAQTIATEEGVPLGEVLDRYDPLSASELEAQRLELEAARQAVIDAMPVIDRFGNQPRE